MEKALKEKRSIVAILVNKLGHDLEEIRTRALSAIVSKLDYGLVTVEELIDKDNLFENLIESLQKANRNSKEEILKLILRLIKEENDGSALLLRADPGLAQLREVTDSDVLVQDIVNLTSQQVNSARYTRSNEDVPSQAASRHRDSARSLTQLSIHSVKPHSSASSKLNTLRTIERVNTKDVQTSPEMWDRPITHEFKEVLSARSHETKSELITTENKENLNPSTSKSDVKESLTPLSVIWSLPPVSLVASDLDVVSAVEDSLRSSPAVQSCHFFTSVMLHDFPAEVFLQHPGVVQELVRLTKKSPESSAAVGSLLVYTQLLLKRLVFCSQLEFCTLKTFSLNDGSSEGTLVEEDKTPREVNQQYHEEGYLSSSSDQQSERKSVSQEGMSVPYFCLAVSCAALSLVGRVQQASTLVLHCLHLLQAVLPDTRVIWELRSDRRVEHIHKLTCGLLHTLGEQIKLSVSYKTVVETHVIAVGLQVIKTLVPVDFAPQVLPVELQEVVSYLLMDPVLVINYPNLHEISLIYATALKRKGLLVYQDLLVVLNAMEASAQFSQQVQRVSTREALDLFQASIPALPFHQQLSLVQEFIQFLVERHDLSETESDRAAELTRSLLAHSDKTVASTVYRVLHDLVTSLLGPRQALSDLDPCPRLRFLISTSVLEEIAGFGVTNADQQIQDHAQDILLHILKCQVLVTDSSWHTVVEQLTPVLPLLLCHASKSTPLGRTLLRMLDPDVANTTALTSLQVLAGNCCLLFHKDVLCREEAVARLLWLTSVESPHQRLADICLLEIPGTAHTPVSGMYEFGSVVRVLEILSAPCVEARVKQSALTQLSVMTEDSRLHQVFIDQRGPQLFVQMLIDILEELTEENSCFIVPLVSTLKHLARHNANIRQNLSHNEQLLLSVVKSLFLLTEWRLQRDASQLLALLLYADFTISSAASISFPQLVVQSNCLPFACQAHWTVSPNTVSSLKGVVLGHMGAERLLSLYWSALSDGMEQLLAWTEVPAHDSAVLTPSLRSVRALQLSHVAHNCRSLLYAFQNATSHRDAVQALQTLSIYLEIHWLTDAQVLSSLPWKNTFRRFLTTPPSCEDDFSLLLLVFKFLSCLLDVCSDQSKWITEALQSPPHTLLDLIVTANSSHVRNDDQDLWKKLCMSTLNLCKKCLKINGPTGWQVLVQLILQCLDSHSQKFYSLVLVDSKLDCLVTAVGQQVSGSDSAVLWHLLTAFHCESPLSYMGLSITRNIVLALNKLLANSKDWERTWLNELNMKWLASLCASRDVLVRALTLQLLSGLARSARGVAVLVQHEPDLFQLVLRILVDHSEASIVREHASILLTNIVKHSNFKGFAALVQKHHLFQEFRESVSLVALTSVSSHSDSSSRMLYTHPKFVKAGCWLIYNILVSSNDKSALQVVSSCGLPLVLWRTLVDISPMDKCEVVSFYTAVCQLLTVLAPCSEATVMEDSLPSLMALLDSSNFEQDSEDMRREVMLLRQQVLKLLRCVLMQSTAEAEFILPATAVSTLCECIQETSSSASLKMSALQAVPAVAKHLTPMDEVSVCEALLTQWSSSAGRTKSALLSALSAVLAGSRPASQTALDHNPLPSRSHLLYVSVDEVSVCEALLTQWSSSAGRTKSALLSALSAVLAGSRPASQTALDHNPLPSRSHLLYVSVDEVSVCEALLTQWSSSAGRTKSALLSALSAVLAGSRPASQTALDQNLLPSVISPPYFSVDEVSVCEALLTQWSSSAGRTKSALLSALSAVLSVSRPASQTALDHNPLPSRSHLLYVSVDEVSVCEALLTQWSSSAGRTKSALLSALSAVLSVSRPASQTGLDQNLLPSVISALQQLHLTLTVQTSTVDKLKKNHPSLTQLWMYLVLSANFLYNCANVQREAARLGLADTIHKLWLWCTVHNKHLVLALDLLITFTADCPAAAATMVLTSTVPGVGLRKSPTSHSLVHTLVSLLTREQHQAPVPAKALTLLSHCCQAQECRTVIAKSVLLSKWSDQWTGKKQPSAETEQIWLRFMSVFTFFTEGQLTVPKTGELFDQLLRCAENGRPSCKPLSVVVLRNLAANTSNRPRFLSTRSALVLLGEKLLTGSFEEKRDVALIAWSLAANHQKAKVALRSLGLLSRLQLAAATSDDPTFLKVADILKPSK